MSNSPLEKSTSNKIDTSITLITQLIDRLSSHSNILLQSKITFLTKLKVELETLKEYNITKLKNVKNLLDYLNTLSNSIITNQENININYLEQMFNYLTELENIIEIEEHTNGTETFRNPNPSFLGLVSHFFQNSNNQELITKVNETCTQVENALKDNEEDSISPTPQQLQLLKIKLKLYFKSNEQVDVLTLKDAILEYSDFLDNRNFTINEVLKKHSQSTFQKIAQLRKKNFDDDTVEPQIVFEVEGYTLLKLISENHLEKESILSGHCVGTSDYYRNKITKGIGEIFSLRDSEGKFCCTIDYDVKNKSILQIRGNNNRKITQQDSFYSMLITILIKLCSKEKDKLGTSREVNSLNDLEELIPKGSFLHKNGVHEIKQLNEVSPEDVLYGNFEDIKINFELHKNYIENSAGIFDLTHLTEDEKNSIKKVKGSILDKSSKIKYAKLQSVGGYLNARSAQTLALNKLQSVGGSLYAENAQTLTLNQLQSVGGYLNARSAKTLALNQLQSVGGSLNASSAKTLTLNQLQSVGGSLNASSAQTLTLNQLQSVGGHLDARSTQTLTLNQLQSVGGYLYASSAQTLTLNQLQSVGGYLDAENAQTLTLNQLQSVGGGLNASSAQTLSLNQLQSVGGRLNAKSAQTLTLKQLESVGGDLWAQNAQTLVLNQLQSVGGDLWARNAQTLALNKLQSVGGDLDAPSAKTLTLNQLQSVGGPLYAENAQTLTLNQLQSVGGGLYAQSAQTLTLNQLQSVGGHLLAENAQTISMPNIKEIKRIIMCPQEIKNQIEETIKKNNSH